MKYNVIDLHCDALIKMQLNSKIDFNQSDQLDVSIERMKQGNVALQCFAIYLSERLGRPKIQHIYDQIDIFHQKIVSKGVIPVYAVEDLEDLECSRQVGGLLSLEGADGLEGDLDYLKVCYERGVRLLGLTWNYANWAADGIMEPRGGGFTLLGLKLVKACHSLGIILDVSHLSERGFWELAELADHAGQPFIASHSNAYSICSHTRNLRDNQIEEIVRQGGRIGITFVPWFVKSSNPVHSLDLLPHIEHICSLGGEQNIMFGSDFDGIETHIDGLKHAGDYAVWVETLLKHYPEPLVKGWIYENAAGFLRKRLPSNKKAL